MTSGRPVYDRQARAQPEDGPIQLDTRGRGGTHDSGTGGVRDGGGNVVDGGQPPHQSFTSVVTAVRWTTTVAALLLLSTGTRTRADALTGAGVLAYGLWRTIRPIEFSGGGRATVVGILVEMAVMVSAVVATGYWNSFFVLGLVTVVCIAGFGGGAPFALPTASACVLAVALPYHLTGDQVSARLTIQWAGELGLVAMVTGYARRLTLTASAETSAFLGRLNQLSEANRLLLQLHHVTTTLPMSLDLNETLDSSATRLRQLFEPDVMVILVRDDLTGWSAVKSSGVQVGARLAEEDLPHVLRQSLTTRATRCVGMLDEAVPGLTPDSRSGLYGPLWARQELVGLVALERRSPGAFAEPQVALLEAFVEQMAVAIDNARWFARIGTLAVEGERSRIARDLHDRVGQSLALVGFELDRAAKSQSEQDLRLQVAQLRDMVRSTVAELRETLYDLRTDVSEDHDLGAALTEYLDRVGRRSGLTVSLHVDAPSRLPLTVEREVWRIAQEAITNAERHARASSVEVHWQATGDGAVLSVRDDGAGMPARRRSDGFGISGMQERADAIGASFTIISTPGKGTEVQVGVRR